MIGPVKPTPDVTTLVKLAEETQKKYENMEAEVKRLRSKNERMEEEVTNF